MNNENQPILPPDAVLFQLLISPLLQKCIGVANELKIPDLLADGPKSLSEIAAQTNSNENGLYRVLRMLASVGVFACDDDKRFRLTPISNLLRSNISGSLHDFASMMHSDWVWENWGELAYCVQTGKPSMDKVQGLSSFEFFQQNKKAGEVFNKAMTSLSSNVTPAIVESYDFSNFETICDIAGGEGLLLTGMVGTNEKSKGILFDLPYLEEKAISFLKEKGLENRINWQSGDFFKEIPKADLYTLKHIIHDWDDDHSLRILKNIRQAIPSDGKVLIIEMLVPNGDTPSPSKILDLMMLVMEDGKERTEKEYSELYAEAGFKLSRIIPTKSPMSLIEGVPV